MSARRRGWLTCWSVPAAVLALAAAFAPAAAARPAAPCWKKLITDWYDGRIDHAYPIRCYRDALRHLPQDVSSYSDAADVISRALSQALHDRRHAGGETTVPPPAARPAAHGKRRPRRHQVLAADFSARPPDGGDRSALADAPVGSLGPRRGTTPLPMPLLVLGGVATLLVAAGVAAAAIRRLHARRGP